MLSLLSEAAEETPLVCLVDEVGWLDPESADALAFAARRLEAEPIAFLVALTDDEAPRFALPNATRMRLSPLGEEDALAVVSDLAAGRTSTTVARQIVDAAGGVPLLLTELVASMTRDQLEGRAPLPDALPAAPDVEDLYLRRVRELPEGLRRPSWLRPRRSRASSGRSPLYSESSDWTRTLWRTPRGPAWWTWQTSCGF